MTSETPPQKRRFDFIVLDFSGSLFSWVVVLYIQHRGELCLTEVGGCIDAHKGGVTAAVRMEWASPSVDC